MSVLGKVFIHYVGHLHQVHIGRKGAIFHPPSGLDLVESWISLGSLDLGLERPIQMHKELWEVLSFGRMVQIWLPVFGDEVVGHDVDGEVTTNFSTKMAIWSQSFQLMTRSE